MWKQLKYPSTRKWTELVYSFNGILLNSRNKEIDAYNNIMDESHRHHVQERADTKENIV